MKVSFIGLGKMGFPMAVNLLAAGHRVTVYNRTRSKADELATRGAIAVDAPEDCYDSSVVISMLSDDNALRELLFSNNKFLDALLPNTVHLCMSTISVALSEKLAEVHARAGQIYVAAPVFGRPEAAALRKLFIVAAGPRNGIESCSPLFEALAKKTFVLGSTAAHANLVKLAGNFLIFAMIESLGEAVAFARKTGLNSDEFMNIITEIVFDSALHRVYGPMIAQARYEPVAFPISMSLKDLGLVLLAAEHAVVPMPFANVIRDQLSVAIARGYQDQDETALSRIAAENAGL
ncbi:MAG TPA: NAD(P)-dependent oxidoreductase, partial [Terriglobia bacterium]|nr:NAD(P)-dependent oxidoreductase [Terriglobia bacterium]